MSRDKLRHISDFEWGSVGQYMTWLEGAVGLYEIAEKSVNSFRLTGKGPQGLAAQKGKAAAKISANMAALERFVAKYQDELGDNEMVVLRGLYRMYRDYMETVSDHIEQCEAIERALGARFLTEEGEEGVQGEFPF